MKYQSRPFVNLNLTNNTSLRHSRVGGNLGEVKYKVLNLQHLTLTFDWIPTYAGMTTFQDSTSK